MKGDPLPIKQGEKHRLKELDGWRALSVLAVIAHHLGAYQYAGVLGQHARSFTFIGALGVKVFFVISGLVICRLLILEEQRYGSASLKSFYIRRVFRILPPPLSDDRCVGCFDFLQADR